MKYKGLIKMSLRKSRQKPEATDNNIKNKINKILDEVTQISKDSRQFDSYYIEKAEELRSIEEDFFPIIAKRFQKSSHKEREELLLFFKYFKGVEHIKFLQEFIRREPFLPRTGLVILEVLNKGDAILEDGLASSLLDLDHLAQTIKQWILDNKSIEQGGKNEDFFNEFMKKDENEQEGIIHQLIEETGKSISSFVIKIIEKNEKQGMLVLNFITSYCGPDSLMILEDIYTRTNKKEISKLIKKTAHSLNQRGFSVSLPSTGQNQEPVFKTITLPEPRAVISSFDPEGYRLLFMIKPLNTHEYKIFNILINDFNGVNEVEVIHLFRKECQQFIDKLFSSEKTEFMEIPPDAAAFLVEEACKTTIEKSSIVTANISQWRTMFADLIGVRRQPLIYDYINKEEILSSENNIINAENFINQTDIAIWFIVSKEAKEYWMKMTNIIYSTLILNDIQKKERVAGLIKDTVRDFFDETRRKVYKRRLEEISFYLLKKDQMETAKIALSIANSLSAPDLLPENNKFCLAFVKRGFDFFQSQYHKDQTQEQSSLITKINNRSHFV
jgi:hypothetical protein